MNHFDEKISHLFPKFSIIIEQSKKTIMFIDNYIIELKQLNEKFEVVILSIFIKRFNSASDQ